MLLECTLLFKLEILRLSSSDSLRMTVLADSLVATFDRTKQECRVKM